MRKKNNGQFKQSMSKLIRYSKQHFPAMLIALLLGTIGVVCQILVPVKIGDLGTLIDAYETGIDISATTKICITILILIIVMAVFLYFQQLMLTTSIQKIGFRLRRDVAKKINKLPLKYFDTNLYGNILSRVTNDVDTIGISLNQSVSSFFTSIVLFVGVVIAMFSMQWIMALTVIAATFVGFMFSLIFLTKSQKYFNQQQQNLGAIQSHIEEVYSGQNVVRLYNAERDKSIQFEDINKKLYTSSWKSQFISGSMGPVMGFVGNFAFIAVCVVGALLVSKDIIDIGLIPTFMIFARQFSRPLSDIAQSLTNLQSASASANRVFEFLEEEELSDESDKTEVLENVKGKVDFEHVKFGYTKDKTIIKDFSVNVEPGQKVAIVGPTGAGKTTLVNLLMKFYEIDDGNILIDGKSIKDLTRDNIHSSFGMVLQDTWLFEGTIKENLKYNSDASQKEIEKVCKSIGVDHFIETLPQGYDTVIDDAVNLSAGQKQLLTIARTMLENKPMLILDEATSSVDTRTEELIQSAMDKLTKGRTSFIIAHRLSTIKNADIILVLKDGDVIESGNHEALMAKNGFYAELYNSQFDEE